MTPMKGNTCRQQTNLDDDIGDKRRQNFVKKALLWFACCFAAAKTVECAAGNFADINRRVSRQVAKIVEMDAFGVPVVGF